MVTNVYEHRSSVTAMMKHLEWPTLEHRREIQRLTMMFKVVRGLVAVPSTQLMLLLINAPEQIISSNTGTF